MAQLENAPGSADDAGGEQQRYATGDSAEPDARARPAPRLTSETLETISRQVGCAAAVVERQPVRPTECCSEQVPGSVTREAVD